GRGVDHARGSGGAGGGLLASPRPGRGAGEPRWGHEPVAPLGDSLALSRQSTSARGFAGGTFDVGAYERELIDLTEVDAQGRWRAEGFAADRLGDAGARLDAA